MPWGYFFEFALMLILMGVGYLASFRLEEEWHHAHYLILIALILLGIGAIALYRRSRQVLP
jgi:hypothetical protein